MITFGADQTQESKQTSRYFHKFVIVINIANIIEELARLFILNDQRYFAFYVFAAPMLFVATLLFILGWRYYIHVKPYDSVLSNCIPVYKNAFQTWRQYKTNKHHTERSHTNVSTSNVLNASDCPTNEEVEESIRIDERPSIFLDFAKVVNYGKFIDRVVDDVKSLQNAIIICILVLPFWLIFTQVK